MTVVATIDAGTNQTITLQNLSSDFSIHVTVFDGTNTADVIVDGNELVQAVSKCLVINQN